MNKKRHLLVIVLIMAGGLSGAALSGRFLTVTSTQARQSEVSGGQKWEYCALSKAGYAASSRGGIYWISFFRDAGVQVVEVEGSASEGNGAALAKAIARLGGEGWEMVGQGPLEIRQGATSALYFKRPKTESR